MPRKWLDQGGCESGGSGSASGIQPTEGREAAREQGTTDREGGTMGTRNKRTAGRFQVETLESRWTPGGVPGGVVGNVYGAACHIGEEIPQQAQVVPLAAPQGGAVSGLRVQAAASETTW
jgi:hypothetical protein